MPTIRMRRGRPRVNRFIQPISEITEPTVAPLVLFSLLTMLSAGWDTTAQKIPAQGLRVHVDVDVDECASKPLDGAHAFVQLAEQFWCFKVAVL